MQDSDAFVQEIGRILAEALRIAPAEVRRACGDSPRAQAAEIARLALIGARLQAGQAWSRRCRAADLAGRNLEILAQYRAIRTRAPAKSPTQVAEEVGTLFGLSGRQVRNILKKVGSEHRSSRGGDDAMTTPKPRRNRQ